MYFVTGGAFNGKSKWVKSYHQLTLRIVVGFQPINFIHSASFRPFR